MRTYTRKRPDYKAIDGVHQLCRLCLSKCEESVPIFTESENVSVNLAHRITICVGLEILREERLPNMICIECLTELNRFYAFRKKCEVTYQKLKTHVLAVKEQEYKAIRQEQINNLDKNEPEKRNGEQRVVLEFDKEQLIKILNVNGAAQLDGVSEKVVELSPVGADSNASNDLIQEKNEVEQSPSGAHSTGTINIIQGGKEAKELIATGPDISAFLTAMLVEMGILTQQQDGLAVTNERIKTLDLESGNGNQVTFELVEEDEIPNVDTDTTMIHQNLETETSEKSGVVRQYGSSNCKVPSEGRNRSCNKISTRTIISCEVCGKRFMSRSALARHLRIHTGEKPFKCPDCGRAFAQTAVMERHRLVHLEERPFKCSECGAGFTQRASRDAHARAHAPPAARALQLHRCTRCPKMFLYKSGLSRHMGMHNGLVYVCNNHCNKMFKDKSSLLRHMKNVRHTHKNTAET